MSKKFSYRCIPEKKWIDVMSDTAPTVCVNDASHKINTSSIRLIYGNSSSDNSSSDTPQNNLDTETAPTGDDNLASGYEIGSQWIDSKENIAYICTDAPDGKDAVWKPISFSHNMNFFSYGFNNLSRYVKVYDTPGTYPLQLPEDVKSITVTAISGGGGGAHGTAGTDSVETGGDPENPVYDPGANGSDGLHGYLGNAIIDQKFTVNTLSYVKYNIVVGAGGDSGVTPLQGGDTYMRNLTDNSNVFILMGGDIGAVTRERFNGLTGAYTQYGLGGVGGTGGAGGVDGGAGSPGTEGTCGMGGLVVITYNYS